MILTLNSFWVLICSFLVFLMIPGLGLIGSGISRSKNSLSQLIQTLMVIPIAFFSFALIGYSLIFSYSDFSFIGGLENIFLQNLTGKVGEIPEVLFFFFQGMFFILAQVLLIGVVAERVRLQKMLLFLFLWGLAVYTPVAYWVWGPNGWIKSLGGLDFAGGLVVHVTTGFSALALSFHLKRRLDYYKLIKKYNNGFIFIGAFLLWLGWFGFNGGSALAFNGEALLAVVNTFVSSLAALFIWYLIDLVHTPHKSYLSHLSMGLVSGLVAITPGAAYVPLEGAFVLGAGAGFIGNYGVRFMHQMFNQDDVLEVFSSHGLCGAWGAIVLGFFLKDHLEVLHPHVVKANFYGTLAVSLYSFVLTSLLVKVLGGRKSFVVSPEVEKEGLDLSEHGEKIMNINSESIS